MFGIRVQGLEILGFRVVGPALAETLARYLRPSRAERRSSWISLCCALGFLRRSRIPIDFLRYGEFFEYVVLGAMESP